MLAIVEVQAGSEPDCKLGFVDHYCYKLFDLRYSPEMKFLAAVAAVGGGTDTDRTHHPRRRESWR